MVHYKCSMCKFILHAQEEARGTEQTCSHCGTVNAVPVGRNQPPPRRHQKDAAHPTHPEAEEVAKPVTVGKILKIFLFGVLAVVSLGAVGVAIYYHPHDPSVAMIEPFEPHLAEYCDITPKDASADRPEGAYIVGQAVIVNFMDDEAAKVLAEPGKEDRQHMEAQANGAWRGMNWREFARLNEAIRAAKYEDVQTIVWVKWSLQNTAKSKKEPHYQVICDVSVIDKTKDRIVGKATFRGGRPTKAESGSTIMCGSRPCNEIVEYLTERPRFKTDEWGRLVEIPKAK